MSETIPGGRYFVNGKFVNANGEPLKHQEPLVVVPDVLDVPANAAPIESMVAPEETKSPVLDELPEKGTAEWEALSPTEKSAITRERNRRLMAGE